MLYLYFRRAPRVDESCNGYGLPYLSGWVDCLQFPLSSSSSNFWSKVARATTSRIPDSGIVSFSIPAFQSSGHSSHQERFFRNAWLGTLGYVSVGRPVPILLVYIPATGDRMTSEAL